MRTIIKLNYTSSEKQAEIHNTYTCAPLHLRLFLTPINHASANKASCIQGSARGEIHSRAYRGHNIMPTIDLAPFMTINGLTNQSTSRAGYVRSLSNFLTPSMLSSSLTPSNSLESLTAVLTDNHAYIECDNFM